MKKKILALMLVCSMAAALAACGSKEAAAEPAAEETEAAEDEAAEEEAAGGTLVMATNAEFPPYEYHDNNEIVGIDVEIAQSIAEELGMTLQIEDMAFDSIILAVNSGKALLI